MGVMMLAAECGSSITIRADGPDAEQAVRRWRSWSPPASASRDGDRRQCSVVSASHPGWPARPPLVVRLDFPEVPDRAVLPDQVEDEVRRLRRAVD